MSKLRPGKKEKILAETDFANRAQVWSPERGEWVILDAEMIERISAEKKQQRQKQPDFRKLATGDE